MINTKFSKEEMTSICQILKKHGTDCKTLVDILQTANSAASNDSINTYKHVRLLKEFGIITEEFKCHMCVMDVINHHAETCEVYKNNIMNDKYILPCPEDHYNYSKCEPAVWMVDSSMIYDLEHKSAQKDWDEGRRENIRIGWESVYDDNNELVEEEKEVRRFDHMGRTIWLEKMFPDIIEEIRFNPWQGFLCDKHIGSMKPYANKIIGW